MVRVHSHPPFDYGRIVTAVVECPELGRRALVYPFTTAPFDYRSGSLRPIEDSWSSTKIMPFIFLGLFVLIIGFLFFRFGKKTSSREMSNGALALILAGFFLLFWGAILVFTGNFVFSL